MQAALAHAFVRLSALRLRSVLLVALGLRVTWLVLCPNEPISDQGAYHNAALRLAAGLGYIESDGTPANHWPVGYPALLGSMYSLFGANLSTAYLLNLVLGLLLVAGVAELGTVLFGRGPGVLAAAVIALHPTFIMHVTMVVSEIPFLVGGLWLMAWLVRLARGEFSWSWSAPLLGAGIGLLAYIRPTGLALLAALPLLGLCFRRWRPWQLVASSAVLVVGAVLVMLPWGLRNQRMLGAFSLTSSNSGECIWMGNNPTSDGTFMQLPEYALRLSLVERERLLRAEGMAFIRANPGRYLQLCVQRIASTLRSDTIAAVWNEIGITYRFGPKAMPIFKVACTAAHWLLLNLLALTIALRLARRQWRQEDSALALLIALMSVPFVLILGGNRYVIPILPLLSIGAASGAYEWLPSVSRALVSRVAAAARPH